MARILVVDHESRVRVALHKLLEHDGHIVTVAESGEQALQRIKDEVLDLVVMDLHVWNVAGVEAISQLKQEQANARVIVTSTDVLGRDDVLKAARLLGATGFLPKPFTRKELRALVRDALGEGRVPGVDGPGKGSPSPSTNDSEDLI